MVNKKHIPLPELLRPSELSEVLGQEHLMEILGNSIKTGRPFSMIFYGPPGSGKTTLARAYAKAFNGTYFEISGVSQGNAEMRKIVEEIEKAPLFQQGRPFLFVDEIHRFTRVQQDFLLPLVEKGILTLLGATTENPSFVLTSALLSRVRTLEVKPLTEVALRALFERYDLHIGKVKLDEKRKDYLIHLSQGDARYLLHALEILEGEEENVDIEKLLQKKPPLYDKTGEYHYNLISALHKSIRGSDPEAALYWLQRMLQGGEDPPFLLRRMIRMASEDIGLADPQALRLVLDAKAAYESLGSPEGELAIYQAAFYLAIAPKSNRLYMAQKEVQQWVDETKDLPPPKNILNAANRWMAGQGFGKGYIYEPDTHYEVSNQPLLPEGVEQRHPYEPTERGFEREVKKRLDELKKQKNSDK